MILMIDILFHTLAFTVNTIALLCVFHCDVIYKTEETIRIQNLAYFVSLFYHLNEFQNFKIGIMGFYTTQAKYLHNKLRINFSMFPPFKVSY